MLEYKYDRYEILIVKADEEDVESDLAILSAWELVVEVTGCIAVIYHRLPVLISKKGVNFTAAPVISTEGQTINAANKLPATVPDTHSGGFRLLSCLSFTFFLQFFATFSILSILFSTITGLFSYAVMITICYLYFSTIGVYCNIKTRCSSLSTKFVLNMVG